MIASPLKRGDADLICVVVARLAAGFAFEGLGPMAQNDCGSRTRRRNDGGFGWVGYGVAREPACYALLARPPSRRSPKRGQHKAHNIDNGFSFFCLILYVTFEFICAGFASDDPIAGYFATQPRLVRSQD